VARFLSPEWIAAFNGALQGVDLGALADGGVRAQGGRFCVEEHVAGVPDRPESAGPLRVALCVDEGAVTLAQCEDGDESRADVVVSLSYEDAAALSKGELDAAAALGTGRVHVRGDLHVLVAGQGILAAASARMAELHADTSY